MIVAAIIAVLLSLVGPGRTAGAQVESGGAPVGGESTVPDSGGSEIGTRSAVPGDLVIELNTCPIGFDLAMDSLGDCTDLSDGIGFTLSGAGVTQSGATGDDGSGRTRFEALAPGTYRITQVMPSAAAIGATSR